MRPSFSLLIIALWLIVPVARAQAAGGPPANSQQAAANPARNPRTAIPPLETRTAAAALRKPRSVHHPRTSLSGRPPSRRATAAVRRGGGAGKTGGVLALGATDITGNKELPKVMVIVPWKDSLGAGGVVKPTDSLLNEALEPVDRGVFQRQIHYYGQLEAGSKHPAASQVAPTGDNR